MKKLLIAALFFTASVGANPYVERIPRGDFKIFDHLVESQGGVIVDVIIDDEFYIVKVKF